MKRIYEFTFDKEETVKEESVEKKKDGTEVTTSKMLKRWFLINSFCVDLLAP